MAKSYLTGEELAEMFPTVPKLKKQGEWHLPSEWGLLTRGLETRFGVEGDGWTLRVPLTYILNKVTEGLFPGAEGAEDICFCYEIDVTTRELRFWFLRAVPSEIFQPGPEIKAPAPVLSLH